MANLDSFKKYKKKKISNEVDSIQEAWFYPRVSSKNQFDNNDSLENQTIVSHDYANKNSIVITKTFGGT